MTAATEHHRFLKIILTVIGAIFAAVVGYLIVYWWVFGDFDELLNVNLLRNQIVAQQQSSDVQAQLEELGFEFEDKDFFHLSNPSTTNYHADVLGAYEPVPVEEEDGVESYYFYDKEGTAYFFELKEGEEVSPENFIPLIQE